MFCKVNLSLWKKIQIWAFVLARQSFVEEHFQLSWRITLGIHPVEQFSNSSKREKYWKVKKGHKETGPQEKKQRNCPIFTQHHQKGRAISTFLKLKQGQWQFYHRQKMKKWEIYCRFLTLSGSLCNQVSIHFDVTTHACSDCHLDLFLI